MAVVETLLKALRDKGGCARLPELAAATSLSVFGILTVLNELLAKGVIKRGRTNDPLNPLSTTEWCLQEPSGEVREEGLGVIEAVVATPPLIKDANELFTSFGVPVIGAHEFLRNALCGTSKYFKLAIPYVDNTIHVFFTEGCINSVAKYKVLVTGQRDESRMKNTLRTLRDIANYLPNVEYRVVDGERGLHAKFLVVDGNYTAVFTFNLYYTHYVRNYDIGVIIRGSLVKLMDTLFDYLWDRARQP